MIIMEDHSMNHKIVQKIKATVPADKQMQARIKMHADLRRYVVYYCMPQGSVGAEVGVDFGAFTDVVLDIITPSKYYLIDPWSTKTKNTYENIRDKYADRDYVKVIQAKGADAAKDIPDESLDWAYIDCSHEKEDVIANVDAYLPKVKKGGYIIGDDTHVKDVIDAFKDLLAAKPDQLELIVHDEVVCNQVIVQKK
jgi:predicted O-methyltransferase YrrM